MRSHPVTRLEGFSDAVFGFALTLLVVSLDVPESFAALSAVLSGFLPFAATFAVVTWIWYEHNAFFRRFGMEDGATIFLNGALLFVVVFYIYPLKFMSRLVVGFLVDLPGQIVMTAEEGVVLMRIYGLGFMILFTLFAALYHHAIRRREALALDPHELWQARMERSVHWGNVVVGGISLLWTLPGNPQLLPIAGMSYALIGVAQFLIRWRAERTRPARDSAPESP